MERGRCHQPPCRGIQVSLSKKSFKPLLVDQVICGRAKLARGELQQVKGMSKSTLGILQLAVRYHLNPVKPEIGW